LKIYTQDEALAACLEYFDGDDLAASVFLEKYCLRNKSGELLEKDPNDMHRRLAREFSRIEQNYKNPMNEDEIFELFKCFKYIVPAGSPLFGVGNPYANTSLSNCVALPKIKDSLSGIFETAKDLANLAKMRCGVGIDLSNLRYDGSPVNNAAKTSSGAWSFTKLFSDTVNMVAQCIEENQRILTKNGLIPIKDAKKGDLVWTQFGWKNILNVQNNGEKIIYCLTTKDGYKIKASLDHKILTVDSNGNRFEKSLGEFSNGDKVVLIPGSVEESDVKKYVKLNTNEYVINEYNNSNRLKRYKLPEYLNEEFAYFLGYYNGDGCNERQKNGKISSISLSCSNNWNGIKNKLKDIIKNVWGYDVCIKNGDGLLEIFQIFSRQIIEHLNQNNLLKEHSKDINIPKLIFSSSKSVKIAYLSGLFDADGCDNGTKGGYNFNSISYLISKQIQDLLMSVGIRSTLHTFKRKQKNWKTIYRVSVVGGYFKEVFREVFRGSSEKVECSTYEIKNDYIISPFVAKKEKINSSRYNFCGNNVLMSTKCFSKLKKLGEFEQQNILVVSNVDDVVKVGETTNTYDITVEDEPMFYCEGFYVHNSGRRGALLESMDISHPDIEKFITCKQDTSKITGANISIKVDDVFMNAVKNDCDYELSWNDEVKKVVSARDLFHLIAKTACSSGEPGFLLWDEMKRRLPLNDYPGWEIITTNACGEIPISANYEMNIIDSCRLISINGTTFIKNPFTEHAEFDYDSFFPVLRAAIRLADDLVDLEIEKLQKMMDKTDEEEMKKLYSALINAGVQGRRIGVGINGIGDILVKMNLRYGSEEAISFVSELYKKYSRCAYHESCVLAEERGPFPIFDWNIEKGNSFICDLDDDIQEMIKTNGRRNGALLTQPPCGTLSILMKSSSGIEPIFKLSYVRRKKISTEDGTKPDFTDEQGIDWKEYTVHHPLVKEWENVTGKLRGEISKDIFVTANDIDSIDRIKMQSAIQKHLDMSISSTINLSKGATPKDIEEIYMNAWKHKLKGCTVYVDGSRDGVLITNDRNGKFKNHSAPKRPKELFCDIHSTSINGKQHIIIVGLFNGKPYEVFAGEQTKIKIPRRYKVGKVVKNSFKSIPSTYDLSVGDDDDELIVSDVVQQFENPNNLSLCRMISLSLRHGASPKYITEQLQKDKTTDFHSFTRGIARTLKQYINDGESANGLEKSCPVCQSEKIFYNNGCVSCSCGWTKCE
jgi:ribonucleoside-diphosphate reductase alpha chain